MIWIYSLSSVLAISLISLIGLASLAWSKVFTKNLIMLLVGLSAGTLLGDALLHLMPEAVDNSANSMTPWIGFISGIVLFFTLEKIIHWRHCHEETCAEHPHPVGLMNLIGDGLHNFLDGVLVAGSFLLSPVLGWTTTIAVISHEIPQEIGDFGILLHAGYSKKKALLFNFLSALTAIVGAIAALIIGQSITNFTDFIIPVTAGGFLYIAASDLIPEMKDHISTKKSLLQLFSLFAGLGLMLAMKLFFE